MINFEFSNTTQIIFGKGTESQVGRENRYGIQITRSL